MTVKQIELLAPAKNFSAGVEAVNCGADAVYIGAEEFGARKAAANTMHDVEKLAAYAHRYRAKVYATVNTILTDLEIGRAQKLIHRLWEAGADAVYLGLPRFSARADADNVTPERLRSLLAYARSFTPAKKVYVTFNTLVQDRELTQALDTLDTLDNLAPDGVIVQDLGVARLVRDHFPRRFLHRGGNNQFQA